MNHHIIVAEDNPDIQEIYRIIFQDYFPCDLSIVETGTQAIREIEQHPPDLLILDVNLPESSGLNVLKYARLKLGLTSEKTKVILVTANHVVRTSPDVTLADYYLEKPFSFKTLLEEIESMLAPITVSHPVTV